MTRHISTHPVSQSRIFFYLLALTLAVVGGLYAFQSRSIEVVASGGTRLETTPGKLLTLSFRVTNNLSFRKRFESTAVVPLGWRRLAKDFPFELDGGGSDVRLLSVSIPSETPAGDYALHYSVKDPANPSEVAEVMMTIVISGVKDQTLKLLESPRIAIAGEEYSSTFLVDNKGNVANSVKLSARSSSGFSAVPDSETLHLSPGESRIVRVRVLTDINLTAKVQDAMELTADLDAEHSAKATSFVEVVPRVTGSEDRWIRFPVTARLRFAGEQAKRGTQLELVGSGQVGNSEDNRLDLTIRTPDIQQKSALGRRDEYEVALTGKSYDAFVGDRNFSLSTLTEYNRYAFGTAGDLRSGRVALGAFYNETRFYTPTQREWAGYLNYRVLDGAMLGLNYLAKQDPASSQVVTLRSLAQPFKRSELELEYGVSTLSGERDDAYSARWTGQHDWLAYDARYIHAGTNYGGYYKDLELKNLTFNVMPFREVRIEGFYRDEERNLNRDTLLYLAPRDRYYQFGISLSNLLAVYYRTNDQDDLLPVPHYRRSEETWQVRAGFNLSVVTMMANADLGAIQDKLAGVRNPFQHYSSYLSLQPFAGQTIGFSAEYSIDHDPTTFQLQKRVAGSVSLNVLIAEATQVAFSLFGNHGWGATEQRYSLLDIGLDHSFPWGHTLSVRGRQTIFSPSFEQKELAYVAEYSVPIGVPIVRSTVSGQLSGRILDAEKGKGVQNVLVYAGGATALTDRNGDYVFPALKPDKYFVQLDMVSVGLNRVALQQLPHEVTIRGGDENRFDISLSRSVVVTGTVLFYAAKEQAANDTTQPVLEEKGGHPNVVMELASGDDVNRRVTDSRGRFSFANIRPGRWTLRVIDGNVPQNYYLDRESVTIDVAPGQSVEQVFKVLPRKRRIQIISQGVTIAASAEKGKTAPGTPEKKIPVTAPPVAKPTEMKPSKPAAQIAGKPAIAQPERNAHPANVPCVVVFWPEKLIFGIQHSEWRRKSLADSVATALTAKSPLSVWVQPASLPDGVRVYRVLIGAFKSRMAAESACDQVSSLK